MKIVKAAVVLLLGMLLVTAFACGGGSEQRSASEGWSTYTNSSSGISMQYPQNWVKNEGEDGSVTQFSAPAGSDSTFAVFSILVIHSEQPVVNLTDWVNICIHTMRDQTDFHLSESSVTTLAGMPAQRVVGTYKLGQVSVKAIDIISVKNSDVVYIIIFLADVATYESDLKTAQQMIDSLVIY